MPKRTPREKCNALHTDINEAMDRVAKRHGLTFQRGSMRYMQDGSEFTTRAVFQGKGAESRVVRQTDRFLRRVPGNWKKDDRFTYGGKTYVVTGATSRGSLLGNSESTGRGYRWSPQHIDNLTRLASSNGAPIAPKTEKELLEVGRGLMSRYCAESVACDGEASRSQVARTRSQGRREWDAFVRKLGRTPSWGEMYPETNKGSNFDKQPALPEGL